MPFVHGRNTGLMLDAVNIAPYFNAADLSAEVATADTTTYGATFGRAIAGVVGAKFEGGGVYDPLNVALTSILTATGSVLTYGPGGLGAIGDLARLIPVVTSNYVETAPIGGAVGFKWSAEIGTAVGFGYLLHPLAEDTNTTTGANRDDGASTSTGWQMHLHVTAVDAGSWVIKLVDASASNFSDVADVTGASFTAATGATSQRLVSASGTTTLRRYVRYVATRTGGAGGDGITFALAVARNA